MQIDFDIESLGRNEAIVTYKKGMSDTGALRVRKSGNYGDREAFKVAPEKNTETLDVENLGRQHIQAEGIENHSRNEKTTYFGEDSTEVISSNFNDEDTTFEEMVRDVSEVFLGSGIQELDSQEQLPAEGYEIMYKDPESAV